VISQEAQEQNSVQALRAEVQRLKEQADAAKVLPAPCLPRLLTLSSQTAALAAQSRLAKARESAQAARAELARIRDQ
jgi:hypothetical protein